MKDYVRLIFLVILLIVILGAFVFIILTYLHKKRKKEEENQEIISDTAREYEENYLGTSHEEEITPQKSIVDLMLKYHKKDLLNVLNLKSIDDIDYVVLTYLNDIMKGTYFERYPFWSILNNKEAIHSLVMLKNALEGASDEDFLKARDIIFAWLNYVFDLEEELIRNRDYVGREDMIKIIDDILKKHSKI